VILSAAGSLFFSYRFFSRRPKAELSNLNKKSMLTIHSPLFADGQKFPKKYACDGENISPPLVISNISENVKSLAILMHDPDAVGGDFTHWIIWNIFPAGGTLEILEGEKGLGVEGANDTGQIGYTGPCPPSGTHRYFFKIFALDGIIDLPEGSGRAQLEGAMHGHILDSGEMMATYKRK